MIGKAGVIELDGSPLRASESTPRARPRAALARVEIITNLAAAEAPWRALERDGALTPYQRFAWISAWQRHVGTARGITPLIVLGVSETGEPLFLLPLGKWRVGPFTVAGFLGGKYANFNFGPWRRDGAPAGTIEAVLARLKAAAPEIDALALLNQPERWEGLANPFATLGGQPSPSFGYRCTLGGRSYVEIVASQLGRDSRRTLRKKESRLKQLPGYRYARARTPAEVDRYFHAFFAQKAGRLAEQGIDNSLGSPDVKSFLREACHHGLAHGCPTIELHALKTEGEVLAVFGCINDGRRFCSMFNSYTLGEHARQSPGLILMLHVINDCVERDATIFDLGVGEAHYKTHFCDEPEPLFDLFPAMSVPGRLLAPALMLAGRLKRWAKRTPLLMQLATRLRRIAR
ncbi:MAG TPA: GNAT family N-acetyltransferase [Xanthobacteraceae bacterium]|nr:GNAT family N-acetyltransferase [Xanthobacteraceae bacterium]